MAEMTKDSCSDSGIAVIALGTRRARSLQVTATVGNALAGGNALVTDSTRIEWRAEGEVAAFRVTFYDLSNGKSIWPFEGKPDGVDARGPYLRVTRDGATLSLLSTGPSEIKYDVSVDEARDDVDPLDPMIIVRPARAQV
jgi:hypothetical protein